jgi:PIN domain nuclease of toxin-antitoxin system
MNLLLDTHAWLWFALGSPQPSSGAPIKSLARRMQIAHTVRGDKP